VVRPTHGDASLLAQEVAAGVVDAAIVTLPLTYPDLQVELLRRDRMVVCLRKEDPLAAKAAVHTYDLQDRLTIFYHPQGHPDAHIKLLKLLSEAGISVEEYSMASHPSEMQALVKEGYGLALVREGTVLEESLTTRPVVGVDWTVDTAVIYHKQRHPKTVPVLVRRLKNLVSKTATRNSIAVIVPPAEKSYKRPLQAARENPIQLPLYRESP
jgi:DNA-binding transcriptional LysR family regulator